MKTILEELYDGNIYPDELIIPKDPGYNLLNQKISDMLEMWKKKLSDDDYKLFEMFMDLRCESSSMEASASFIYGFKLGTLIMIEVLSGRDELIRGQE